MSNVNFLTNGKTVCGADGINRLPEEGGTAGTTTEHDQVISAAIMKVQPCALPSDASDPTDES